MNYKLRVADNGDIQSQYRTSEDEPVHGSRIDGLLCCDSDTVLDMHLNYWNGESWATRSAAPSEFCVWSNDAWVVSPDKREAVVSRWLETVRVERNMRLMQCDWTQAADSPLSDEGKSSWADYRQALRDVPASSTDILSPTDVEWPTAPSV